MKASPLISHFPAYYASCPGMKARALEKNETWLDVYPVKFYVDFHEIIFTKL